MNIYEKILAIMQEVQRLQKDDMVKFGGAGYKALSEEKVTSIMREQLIKQKMVVFPIRQETTRNGNITHVDVQYRMVNVEDPDDFIEIVSCGDGADTQDKGSGKAMTYSFKYMWLRTFALPTGEDPDKISSEELDAQEKVDAIKKQPIGEKRAKALEKELSNNHLLVGGVYQYFGVTNLAELTEEQQSEVINDMVAFKKRQLVDELKPNQTKYIMEKCKVNDLMDLKPKQVEDIFKQIYERSGDGSTSAA